MPVLARLLGAALLLQGGAAHDAGSGAASRLASDAEVLSAVDATAAGRLLTHSIGTLERTLFWKSSKKEVVEEEEAMEPVPAPRGSALSPEPSPEPSPAPSPEPSSAPSPERPLDTLPEPSPAPSPEPSSAPSPEPPLDTLPEPTAAATAAPAASPQRPAGSAAAASPAKSAKSPSVPEEVAPVSPLSWPSENRTRLVEDKLAFCTTYKGKQRGMLKRFVGIGDNSYQSQVDDLGNKCDAYGSLQKKAKKARAAVKKLDEEIKKLETDRNNTLEIINQSLMDIEKKGTAIDKVAELIKSHTEKNGESLLQDQSLPPNP